MQENLTHVEVPSDSVTELTIPVIGVAMKINQVCSLCGQRHEFELCVYDLDSGKVFKSLRSEDLHDLLQRQHQLMLGFTEP